MSTLRIHLLAATILGLALAGSAAAQCGPGNGDCCAANGTPGCEDAACCTAVCADDAFCCDVEWDAVCAAAVAALCDPGLCPPPCNPGAGDCFVANGGAGCNCEPCCELVCALDAFCCDVAWDGLCAATAIAECSPTLALVAADVCVDGSEVVSVSVVLQSCKPAAGFQAFIEFDAAALSFVGGTYTAAPFGLPVVDPIVAAGGEINLAAGIDPLSQTPFADSAPAVLAVLQFERSADDCVGSPVAFRTFVLPTRLTALGGAEIPGLTLEDSDPVAVDGSDPVWTFLPSDVVAPADAGGCTAVVSFPPATAFDACGAVVAGIRSDMLPLGDPYPAGTTTVTWTATDPCGNVLVHLQTIEVLAVNELVVSVALEGAIALGPIVRCIEFEALGCPGGATVSADVTFVGGIGSATVAIPCADGPYDCLMVRDPLHTLRRTVPISTLGTQYVADATGGSALRGGNADGNEYIDILDFGVFALQYGVIVGSDTPCPPAGPHADFNGDGVVDLLDFTFIQIAFLEFDEAGCACPLPMAGERWPISRISVARLHRMGRGELAKADLNLDGWLDPLDIVAFLSGSLP